MPRRKKVPNELSPKVVFNVQYHNYRERYNMNDKKQRKDAWYHCHPDMIKQGGDVLTYTGRNNATDKRSFEQIKEQIEMLEEKEMSFNDVLEYIDKRYGSTGHFNAQGDIQSLEEVTAIRERIRATKSNVWSAVLSLTPDFANQYLQDKVKGHQLLKEIMPKFFKEANFDLDNVEWIADYHTNTPHHPHIHINFWEKEPLRLDSKNNLCYHQDKIKLSAIQNFKYNVINYFTKESNLDYLKMRDDNRSLLRSSLYSSPIKDAIINIAPNFEENSSSYNRLPRERKDDILNLIDLIKECSPEFKNNHDKYIEEIYKHHKNILDTFKKANTEPTAQAKSYAKTRIDDYYSRLGNEVLKTIKKVLEIQKIIDDVNSRSESDKKEIQRIQSSFSGFDKSKISLSLYKDCVEKLSKEGFEPSMLDVKHDKAKEEEIKNRIAALSDKNNALDSTLSDEDKALSIDERKALVKKLKSSLKTMKLKSFDASNLENYNLDRRVLREYGVDYFVKEVEGKPLLGNDGQIKLIKGKYMKYTLVNANGEVADYYLSKSSPQQKSFPNVLKEVGLSDLAIFNIATRCKLNTLTNNLIIFTGSYSSKWLNNKINQQTNESLKLRKSHGSDSKLIHQRKQEFNFLGRRFEDAIADLFGSMNDETKLLLGYIEHETDDEILEKLKERDDGYEL